MGGGAGDDKLCSRALTQQRSRPAHFDFSLFMQECVRAATLFLELLGFFVCFIYSYRVFVSAASILLALNPGQCSRRNFGIKDWSADLIAAC